MEMQQLQEQHRKLQAFAGNWVGEEKIYPSPWDPKGGPATSRVESRVALGGFFVISDYTEERNGQVSYLGHGIYGWDPAEKCYAMYWVDGMGGVPKGYTRGLWEGNTLTFEQKHPQGYARYVYKFEGEGQYMFRIENSQDGKEWKPFMEGKYTRQ